MNAELITQAEYARRRGCAKSAVAKAVKTGRIRLVDGLIDPVQADADWLRNSRVRIEAGKPRPPANPRAERPAKVREPAPRAPEADSDTPQAPSEPPASTPRDDYAEFRAKRERVAFEREALKAQQLAGELIPLSKAKSAAFDVFRTLRDAAFAVPATVAPRLLGVDDVAEIERSIADELRAAFRAAEEALAAA